jgi:hypothetical protein
LPEDDYEIIPMEQTKHEIDISGMPAPDVTDTRTDETEAAFLASHFTPDQINDLRQTVRFARSGDDDEPTDWDLADIVTWFQDQGWSDMLDFQTISNGTGLVEEPVVEGEIADEDLDDDSLFDKLLRDAKGKKDG